MIKLSVDYSVISSKQLGEWIAIIGTRHEIIKMSPVIRECEKMCRLSYIGATSA